MSYDLSLPSGRPENVPQEYIPHLLSAIEGFLQMPDMWSPSDYAEGRQMMEQLKVYIIECFGNCGDAMVYPNTFEVIPFVVSRYSGNPVEIFSDNNLHMDFYVRNNPLAQGNGMRFSAYMAAGTWNIVLLGTKNTNHGIVTCLVDDNTQAGSVDMYAAAVEYNVHHNFAVTIPESGNHYIAFQSLTKNAASTNYNFVISYAWGFRSGA